MGKRIANSFDTLKRLKVAGGEVNYYSLNQLSNKGFSNIDNLPFSIKILLEGVLRAENGQEVTPGEIENIANYQADNPAQLTIPYLPARVLMQDFTGVPAVVDLAALRSALARLGGDPQKINPQVQADLVIDHSVQVDYFASSDALPKNIDLEFKRNFERYQFLRWGAKAFKDFRVIPPGSGIIHQVNLEYLAKVVQTKVIADDQLPTVFPDTLVGTDSHTTMINGLGVLGWGVGGIEAEAVLLGQPYFMSMPEVIGFKLFGRLEPMVSATDAVLTITQILREKGVVGKFVEFFGQGLSSLTLPDRATISNMAPEYGATMGFFPVDQQTLRYLKATGRSGELLDLVERYTKEQGLYREENNKDPQFKEIVELDLSSVQPSLAGPKRPQDRLSLSAMKSSFAKSLKAPIAERGFALKDSEINKKAELVSDNGQKNSVTHGFLAIASITSCTNTSNPSVMLTAGLLAKNAVKAGLTVQPFVKTSLAPGSLVVTKYLDKTGLTEYLEKLGFHTVGYGCTTCIGNSGPLPGKVKDVIEQNAFVAASVLSGNRNFEGRVSPHLKANYLASPALVVAYALAGTVDCDLTKEPLGSNEQGQEIFLKDIWPSTDDLAACLELANDPQTYQKVYQEITTSNKTWNAIEVSDSSVYNWQAESSYIQEPPFFKDLTATPPSLGSIEKARVLVKVGDSVTTDHISPAGSIAAAGPAAKYLRQLGVEDQDFNSFGSRRGNDRVMVRGTFANIRLKNQLAPGTEGGFTTNLLNGQVSSIYQAAVDYRQQQVPLLVIAGKDYGMGSSRDWAAKGTYLLGVRAVIAASFERIHRSNLVGMGVLPLQFKEGKSAEDYSLTGKEKYTIVLDNKLEPRQSVLLKVEAEDGKLREIELLSRLDSEIEIEYYRHGGILHKALREMLQ